MAADTVLGSAPLFSAGFTTVHELSHWLGLPHTFDNDYDEGPEQLQECASLGDHNFDTPAEKNASFGCMTVGFRSMGTGYLVEGSRKDGQKLAGRLNRRVIAARPNTWIGARPRSGPYLYGQFG